MAVGLTSIHRHARAERLVPAIARRTARFGAGAYATGLRGEIALRRGEFAAARTLFRASLGAAETLALTPLATSIRQRLDDPANRAHPWLDGVALAP